MFGIQLVNQQKTKRDDLFYRIEEGRSLFLNLDLQIDQTRISFSPFFLNLNILKSIKKQSDDDILRNHTVLISPFLFFILVSFCLFIYLI